MHAFSVSLYVLQVRRFSLCSRVRYAMTSDAGVSVGIVTVGPLFVGTTNVVADSKAYTAGEGCESKVSECSASNI